MPVVVVATVVPDPEHRDEVVTAIKAVIEQVHQEDGCELYALHEAADRLVMVEKWESEQALATHSKGPALAALGRALAGKVTGAPEVIVLQQLPAGDPAKGQL
jgi:quinol monooxygenase YgiN